MKFKQTKPAIHRNSHDFMMWDLRREFERLLLVQAVVESYCTPCMLTRRRIQLL